MLCLTGLQVIINDVLHGNIINSHLRGSSRIAKFTEEISWQAHPNVFEIVHKFKAEQAAVEVSLAQLQTGAYLPPRSYSAIEKMKKIEEMKRKFASE